MAGTTGITIPGPDTMFMTVEANAIGGTKIIADTGKDAETGEPVIMGSALEASINGVAAGVPAITATVMRGHPGARGGLGFGNRGAVREEQRARSPGTSRTRSPPAQHERRRG